MTDKKWVEAWSLYEMAIGLPGPERHAFVHSTSGDPEIVQTVLTMLTESELPPSDARPGPGTKIGRYTMIGELGRGGMGTVYSARDMELDRTVALKVLPPASFGDRSAEERFIREAKAASALNHPNIVTVYEVIRWESGLAIAMERVEGKALRTLCETRLRFDQVIYLGQQIASALAAAHASSIIHRDIKPENILVRDDGYAKVLDFGLARRVDGDQSSIAGMAIGTLRYMSPEQSRGETLTSASDVFSLGIVLYELAAGRHPFAAESPFATAHDILTKNPTRPSESNPAISQRLDFLILSMLAKEPSARPSAAQVAGTLEEIRPRAKDDARAPSDRWLAVAAAVAFIVAAGIGIWSARDKLFSRREAVFRQITTNASENQVVASTISPDGELLAYSDYQGLILVREISTGSTRPIARLPEFHADRIVWFSDGTRVLVSGHAHSTQQASVWILTLKDAPPRLFRNDAKDAAPSPDESRIVFASADGREVLLADADGQNQRKLVVTSKPNYFSALLWLPNSRIVAYQRLRHTALEQTLVKGSYEFVDVESGKVVSSLSNVAVQSATVLPDGRIFFLQPESKEGFEQDLWLVRTDPKTGASRGTPALVFSKRQIALKGVTAAADGKHLAVVGMTRQTDVYVGDLERPGPRLTNFRRLTLDLADDYVHAWTSDSQAVIFESNRNGAYDLFKQRLDQPVIETLIAARDNEALPQTSPDGRWVLYASWDLGPGSPTKFTLHRVPITGGKPETVPIGGPLDEFRCPVRGKSCVLRTTENGQHIFSELDPIQGKGHELGRIAATEAPLGDWALSADGTKIAIPNHDPNEGRIGILDLDTAAQNRYREVAVTGTANLFGIHWDVDGKGWFVHVKTPLGWDLYYVDLNGRSRLLREGCRWGVPSPDGRRLATANDTVNGNVWLIEGL